MRGQAILLAGLLVVAAAFVVLMMYSSISSAPLVAGLNPAYGYISKAWPDAVRLVEGYVAYQASSAAYALARGALDVGGYANHNDQASASRWLQYNATSGRIGTVSQFLATTLAPLGVNAAATGSFYSWGFNGTLGPYPLATSYGSWSWQPARAAYSVNTPGGAVSIRIYPASYLKTARLVVLSQVDVPSDYYVVTYMGSVDQPATVGMGYNDILSDLLAMGRPWGKVAMYALNLSALNSLSGCDPVRAVKLAEQAIKLLYWAPEIYICPFCMIHVRTPPGFLQAGKASEILVTYSPGGILPGPQFTVEASCGSQYYRETYDPFAGNNLNLADYTNGDGDAVGAFKRVFGPQYFQSADDIAGWQNTAVTALCRSPSGSVLSYGVSVGQTAPPISVFTKSAYVTATYSGGTTNRGFNVYRQFSWNGAVGYKVEALVMTDVDPALSIRPARLDLYLDSDPTSTHPICANVYAVQAVQPALVWTMWYGGSGVWNGRTWDVGYVVYTASRQWYLFSVGVDRAGTVQWQAYRYNASGVPVQLAAQTVRSGQQYSSQPWVVLGSAIVEKPASSSPWTEAAYYVYVRMRPWVYPEPAVALAPLGAPPVATPARPEIFAVDRAALRLTLSSRLDIYGALVRGLNLTVPREANATIEGVKLLTRQHDVTYWLTVRVYSAAYRAALAANFTVYYLLGNSPREVGVSSALFDYGDYWARYNVTFTVPRRSSFAVKVTLPGAMLALSPGRPDVRYLQVYSASTYNSYYVANYGTASALFVFGPGELLYFDDGWNKDIRAFAGYFGARYDVTDGKRQWTVVVVPPGGLVQLDVSKSVDLRTRAVPWQRAYMSQIQPPSSSCYYKRLYIPTNISSEYYVFYADNPSVSSNIGSLYIYTSGQWQSLYYNYTGQPSGGVRYWFRVDGTQGTMDYSGFVLAFCPGGRGPVSLAGLMRGGRSSSQTVSLTDLLTPGNFPDGYTVWVLPSQQYRGTPLSVVMDNSSSVTTATYDTGCSTSQERVGILYQGSPIWWWHFDGFCYDRHIWELQSSSTTYVVYAISLSLSASQGFVLYRIWDPSFALGGMWKRGYPNQPVSGPPFHTFNYMHVAPYGNVGSAISFEWYVSPFAWPEPYVK